VLHVNAYVFVFVFLFVFVLTCVCEWCVLSCLVLSCFVLSHAILFLLLVCSTAPDEPSFYCLARCCRKTQRCCFFVACQCTARTSTSSLGTWVCPPQRVSLHTTMTSKFGVHSTRRPSRSWSTVTTATVTRRDSGDESGGTTLDDGP
jgi:hypothetical protein